MILIRKKAIHSDPSAKSGFLNISQKTDCGLVLLAELAFHRGENPLSLRDIAEKKCLSFFFLQKVAMTLRKAGIIKADRGKYGGYRLSMPGSKITLLKVLEALEGPISVMHCLTHEPGHLTCSRAHTCGIRSGFGMLNQVILQSFSNLTLSDFLTSSWNQKKISSK